MNNATENLAETGKGMLQDAIMAGVPNTYEAGYTKVCICIASHDCVAICICVCANSSEKVCAFMLQGVEVMEKKKNELRAKIAALRKQLDKVKKSIAEDRSSSNKLTYMVDQGGGSFTAYVFAPGANELAKIKSSKHPELLDAELMTTFKSETGINLYNEADGVHAGLICILAC